MIPHQEDLMRTSVPVPYKRQRYSIARLLLFLFCCLENHTQANTN